MWLEIKTVGTEVEGIPITIINKKLTEYRKPVMYNAFAPFLLSDAKPISEQCPSGPFLPNLFADHDTTWSGISLGLAGVSCPGWDPSQLLGYPQSTRWWGNTALCQLLGRKLILSRPKPGQSNQAFRYLPCFISVKWFVKTCLCLNCESQYSERRWADLVSVCEMKVSINKTDDSYNNSSICVWILRYSHVAKSFKLVGKLIIKS